VRYFIYAQFLKAPHELREATLAAEAAGLDGVMLAEHLLRPEQPRAGHPQHGMRSFDVWLPDTPYPDVFVTIGWLAAVTTRLKFLTGIYVLPLRNVFTVAKAVGTAAVVSDNRILFGVGAGWMKDEFEIVGSDFHTRGKRMEEMIDVMRLLWRGGMVEYHGTFHDFDRLAMAPAPTKPVPIYLGGNSPPALRRAARVGDGYLPTGAGEEPWDALKGVRDKRRELGRADEPFDYMLRTPEVTPEFHERALAAGVTTTVVVLPQDEVETAREAIAALGETARALR